MNKFLMASLIAGVLLFMPAAEAAIETYTGEGSATMSEAESQDDAIARAKNYALRDAQEQAGVYIRSQSRMKDLELVDDELETLTAGFVKIKDKKIQKSLENDVFQVRVTVIVEIDTDALQSGINKILEKRNIQPVPIERPKPIEEPVQQPEQQPEPAKEPEPPPSEPTKPEDTKPVEPIKPSTPVEPVKPPPIVIQEPSTPATNLNVVVDEQSMVSGLMDAINAERAKVGKQPLTRDVNLAKGAKVRVEELTKLWSHKRPNGSNWWTALIPSYQNKSMWEYIHSGCESPQEVIAWYAQQAENRTLSSDYKSIGIAYLYRPDTDDKHYWVVILG